MRQHFGTNGEHRSSGLWGKGSRGETRANALWGRGGRGAIALFALVVSVIVPSSGLAHGDNPAVVPASLLSAAQANPDRIFHVIVQGERGRSTNDVASRAQNEGGKVKRKFRLISGASVDLSGKVLLKLARDSHVFSITPDVPLRTSALNTSPPTIAGVAEEGQTLTASDGTWTSSDPIGYAYQWQRCDSAEVCSDILGASAASYAVAGADVGSMLRVVVTATDTLGSSSASSASTAVVASAPAVSESTTTESTTTESTTPAPPANIAAPTIAGVARSGQTLTASAGAWTGTEPISYAFQWRRCDSAGVCSDIAGATGASYDVAVADISSTILVVVTASDAGGSASASSAATALVAPASSNYQNGEMWRESTHVDQLWNLIDPYTGLVLGPAPQAPAIAIVDSGIDASKVEDFGSRVVASVNFSSLSPGEPGDSEGHGTMVAALAAGASPLYPGVSQSSPIIDLRTSDANGQSLTSDVIAAADWILANKERYNIRVANFSMAGAVSTSFRFDPLDKAVERLWFSGIVVVAAAGNHGSGSGAVDMSVAPGNDPFIITVGALDQQQSADAYDDSVAPWSAYGYTMDGFSKPDMAAPGRYMVAAVPMSSTIPNTVPERVVAPGYMWMSGTSFAAPVVAGAAAQLLARHPDWGPDEVKGALMLTSAYLAGAGSQGAGVGEIDAASAASLDFTPPSPNENFYAFVETDPATGLRTFNEASWSSALASNASWSSANWSSASWSSASWSSANWASASWSSANWSSDVSSMMSSAVNWSESTYNP